MKEVDPDILAKLAEYEKILGENGLLPGCSERVSPLQRRDPATENGITTEHMQFAGPEPTDTGRLLPGRNGESQYVSSKMWNSLGDDEAPSEDEDAHTADEAVGLGVGDDPLVAAFMNLHKDLVEYHPSREDALFLWKIHVDRVEPLCKVSGLAKISEAR